MLRSRLLAIRLPALSSKVSSSRIHFFSSSSSNEEEQIRQFLRDQTNLDSSLHDNVWKALQNVYGKENVKLEHVESLSTSDLQDLAAAAVVVARRSRNQPPPAGRPSCTIHVRIPHENRSLEVTWKQGESLLDLAQRESDLLGPYLEGSCGGTMGCCTCHVYVDDETLPYLPTADEAELDMLDLAYRPNESSRLGCQIRLTSSLLRSRGLANNKITIAIPAGVNNVWQE